jgi:hypothetical protein
VRAPRRETPADVPASTVQPHTTPAPHTHSHRPRHPTTPPRASRRRRRARRHRGDRRAAGQRRGRQTPAATSVPSAETAARRAVCFQSMCRTSSPGRYTRWPSCSCRMTSGRGGSVPRLCVITSCGRCGSTARSRAGTSMRRRTCASRQGPHARTLNGRNGVSRTVATTLDVRSAKTPAPTPACARVCSASRPSAVTSSMRSSVR